MTTDQHPTDRDDLVARLLAMDSPPPPRKGFWQTLYHRMAGDQQPVRLDAHRRRRRVPVALISAAAVVAVIAAIGIGYLVDLSQSPQQVDVATDADQSSITDDDVSEFGPTDPNETEIEISDDLDVEPPSQDSDSATNNNETPSTAEAQESDLTESPERPDPEPDPQPVPDSVPPSARDLLIGDWVRETGTSYVPSDIGSSGGRFQQTIVLRENDTASLLVLARDDMHYEVNGSWGLTDNDTAVQISVTSQNREADEDRNYVGATFTIAILDLLPDEDRLELEVSEPTFAPEPDEPDTTDVYTHLVGQWTQEPGTDNIWLSSDDPPAILVVREDGHVSFFTLFPNSDKYSYMHGQSEPIGTDSILVTVSNADLDPVEFDTELRSIMGLQYTIRVIDPLPGQDRIELEVDFS